VNTPTIYRYVDLRPGELREQLNTVPVALLPWGALEWHGPHLPFGLDGLVAEAFSEKLAAASGAVLLPTTYLPITSLPHPQSISISAEHVAGVWSDLFRELDRVGFRLVCVVSGHYAQGHEWVLMQTAESAMAGTDLRVLAGTPLSLIGEPSLLDHAGRWETSQLLHVRPDLVDVDALPSQELPGPAKSAVLGEDPRAASAEQGERLFEQALASWMTWIDKASADGGQEALADLYEERRTWYQEYVDRHYRGSWEEAIKTWWASDND
jgi:creatinine amidohydrolase